MPILVIENGTIVPDANSYATLEQIRTYVTARGYVLPIEDDIVSSWAIRAMDYLATFSKEYKGVRSSLLQLLDWPRTGVIIDDVTIAVDYMPPQLIYAQAAAVVEINNGVELLPVRFGSAVRAERVGSISVEYFSRGGAEDITYIATINNILEPLLDRRSSLVARRV